ncbi:MAG: arginase family protein, partial [Candidatus Aenigmarchaeota archaeon]|nr:arginase family protein [Candidatus Aenigmarchaeota archaeon]MDW8149703.1 arginase family protein [Candidatus Aenigmarchaeota archaeon]
KKIIEKIRETSWYVEPFDLQLGKNLLENIRIFDLGNYNVFEVGKKVKKILEIKKTPLIFSNSHLSTYYVLKSIPNKPNILIFDAHLDLKSQYKDKKIYGNRHLNDATWLRRSMEKGLVSNVFFFGARSCDEDEYEFIKLKKIKIVKKFMKKGMNNLYISFDFDVYDPSLISSTEYPEPNGINFEDIRNFLEKSKLKAFILDFCLMNLSRSLSNEEAFLIVKTIFEFLSKINLCL